MIRFTTDDTEMPALDERKIGKWIRSVAAEYGFSVGNINYIFCTPTTLNGDIFISLDTVRSNAEMVSTTFDHELLRILIHGVLHLTGQGDKTPETKAQMTQKEESALAKWV